jgi:hypothetical protein
MTGEVGGRGRGHVVDGGSGPCSNERGADGQCEERRPDDRRGDHRRGTDRRGADRGGDEERERDARPPRRLADGLDRVLDGLGRRGAGGTRPTSGASGLFSRWDELVGADIARRARPLGVQDGQLVVAVDDPAWASQLRWLANDLLIRIAAAGGPQLEGLRVRVKPR